LTIEDGSANRSPPLPLTGYATLGCISPRGEFSAVEIQRRANAMLRFFYWTPALSHIRRELDRLEQLGYVTAREVSRGRVRRTLKYQITETGAHALREWAEAPSVEPAVVKNSVILRIWLGRRAAEPKLVLRALDPHLGYIESERAVLRTSIRAAETATYTDTDLDNEGNDGSDPSGTVFALRRAWVLSVLRYCARDLDHEIRNLKILQKDLEVLAASDPS
jgi:DNA-binding PadR family transcriptional regulator